MKKNDYLLLAATATYSFLFYRQNAGINLLLFTVIFTLLLVFKNEKRGLVAVGVWCILPGQWSYLQRAYKRRKQAADISTLNLQMLLDRNLSQVKQQLFREGYEPALTDCNYSAL